MAQTIIDVRKLTKCYGTQTILKQISFQIKVGETVALLGENGAGKSTLINLLNQLLLPTSGQLAVFGQAKLTKSSREKIGVMLQTNLTLNRIKVKELLQLVRSYYQKPLSYQTLIGLAHLQAFERADVSQLSGGQKRRLTFAIAMAGDPQLVFLDEPTVGMDSHARQTFWQEIELFKQSGKTFLVTSHYLSELEEIADRIMILKDTKLCYDGTLTELRRQTGHFSIKFKSSLTKNLFEQLIAVKAVSQDNGHYELITDDVSTLLTALQPYLAELSDLSVQQHSLESLFNALITGGQA